MKPTEAATRVAEPVDAETHAIVTARCESAVWSRLPPGGRGVGARVYLAAGPATEWMPVQVVRGARLRILKREYPGEYAQ